MRPVLVDAHTEDGGLGFVVGLVEGLDERVGERTPDADIAEVDGSSRWAWMKACVSGDDTGVGRLSQETSGKQ